MSARARDYSRSNIQGKFFNIAFYQCMNYLFEINWLQLKESKQCNRLVSNNVFGIKIKLIQLKFVQIFQISSLVNWISIFLVPYKTRQLTSLDKTDQRLLIINMAVPIYSNFSNNSSLICSVNSCFSTDNYRISNKTGHNINYLFDLF